MKKHILLEKAHIYNINRIEPKIDGCSYDSVNGYWLIDENQLPIIFDSDWPKPQSKKNDIETGEDQKGE